MRVSSAKRVPLGTFHPVTLIQISSSCEPAKIEAHGRILSLACLRFDGMAEGP